MGNCSINCCLEEKKEKLLRMRSELLGEEYSRPITVGDYDDVFINKLDLLLSENGYVKSGLNFWKTEDDSSTVSIFDSYYDNLESFVCDRVEIKIGTGTRTQLFPFMDGPAYVSHYEEHLQKILDWFHREIVNGFKGNYRIAEERLEEGIPSKEKYLKDLATDKQMSSHGMSASEIAYKFKTNQRDVKKFLDGLVKEGYLSTDIAGRTKVYLSSPKISQLVSKIQASDDHNPGSVDTKLAKHTPGGGYISHTPAHTGSGKPSYGKEEKRPGEEDDDIFGPVISVYTRKQALDDGVLVDVTKFAKEDGFKWPTAFTVALWHTVSKKWGYEDLRGRMADIFTVMKFKIRSGGAGSYLKFTVKIAGKNRDLMSVVGPGDHGEPVMTVGYPSDF